MIYMHTTHILPRGMDKEGRVRYIVSGNVQRVRYRDYIADNARKLSLKGQVQNMIDGDVEVIVEGAPENLEKFDKIMQEDKKNKKASSKECLATDIDYKPLKEEPTGKFPNFSINYSISVQEELNENFGAALILQMRTNNAIHELTTQTNNNFNAMEGKYDKISKSIDKLAEELPKKLAEELSKLIKPR